MDSLRKLLPVSKSLNAFRAEDTNIVIISNKLCTEYIFSIPDTAEIYAKQALALAKEIKDKKGMSKSLEYLGIIQSDKGNFSIAIEYYQRALALEKELHDNFEFGYFATDLNGDGNVDLLDSPVLEPNINNFIFLNHP